MTCPLNPGCPPASVHLFGGHAAMSHSTVDAFLMYRPATRTHDWSIEARPGASDSRLSHPAEESIWHNGV